MTCWLTNLSGSYYVSERKRYSGIPLTFVVAEFFTDPINKEGAVAPGSYSANCYIHEEDLDVVRAVGFHTVAPKTEPEVITGWANKAPPNASNVPFTIKLKRLNEIVQLPSSYYHKPLDFGWWWGDVPDIDLITLEPEIVVKNLNGIPRIPYYIFVRHGNLLKYRKERRDATGCLQRQYHIQGTLDDCKDKGNGNMDCFITAIATE